MNYQLHIINNRPILTSDEVICVGDWVGYPNLNTWTPIQYLGGDLIGYEKKIVAGISNLPKIRIYNNDCEKLGLFDIENYVCEKYSIKEGLNDYDENYYNGINVNLAQSFIEGYIFGNLLNKNKFTFDDVAEMFQQIIKFIPETELRKWDKDSFISHFKSLNKNKVYNVDVTKFENEFKVNKIL